MANKDAAFTYIL